MRTIQASKRIAKIIGDQTVSTTNVAVAIGNQNITINVLSGNLWINPNAVAVADSTAFKLSATGGSVLDLDCSTLNMISDATGAHVQIIVWEN